MIRAVTVYCSSSSTLDPAHTAAATELGAALAAKGWTLVYGGNDIGLMKAVADAVRGAGGRVVGITPQLLVDRGLADAKADELIVTDTLRRRKELLEARGDGFIALPGGLGTFEEFFEILVGRALRYHDKPIVLLDIDGYYQPLVAMIEHGIAKGFIREKSRRLFFVARSVVEAVEHLSSHPVPAPRDVCPSVPIA